MANVTASSSEYQGESAITVQRTPGGKLLLNNIIIEIIIFYFNDGVLFSKATTS